MIRTLIMLSFWGVTLPIAALVCMPWTLLTGDIRFMYRVFMWGAATGVRLAGIRAETAGLEKLDPSRNYIYMSNHASNIDPPLMLPLIPGRTSVLVKKELFKVPVLGKAMRMGSMVPVDRGDREAGIAASHDGCEIVLREKISMAIYIEGGRSFDGRLRPFKKGPFYFAEECKLPVVPVTISGSQYAMPKGRFAIKPCTVQIIFHDPIEPQDFGSRECLMEKVRRAIESGLSEELREPSLVNSQQHA